MSRAKLLSVIVPGKNEQFMAHTVQDVLENSSDATEVIAVADGFWPEPGLKDHPRLQMIHFSESVGQRAATNAGVALSRAKYVMKLDAHCSVDEGFDDKMIAKMEPDMTMIPAMHRLKCFEWHCVECGERQEQGSKPLSCPECPNTEFSIVMVWEPRFQHAPTVTWRLDRNLNFQYFRQYKKRDSFKKQEPTGLADTMSCIGCCFLVERQRFLDLEMIDERHGSWGAYGCEIALKSWLSGGRLVTCLDTYIAHLFRTSNFSRNGESSWPYEISQKQIDRAKKYSRDMWLNNAWPKQTRPLSWLLEKFWPLPDWTDKDLDWLKKQERNFVPAK